MEKQCVLSGTLKECATLEITRETATTCGTQGQNTLSYTNGAKITTLQGQLGAIRSTAGGVPGTPIALHWPNKTTWERHSQMHAVMNSE